MADQVSAIDTERHSSDSDRRAQVCSVVTLARHDTSSSTASAKTLPAGLWKLNLSGSCSGCNHSHNSVQIQVTVSNSNHVSDVTCENCHRPWIGFGRRNSAPISLLSPKTLEPDPLETDFRSTLIHMIRSANTVAALSSNLPRIPESIRAGPSHETSMISTRLSDTDVSPVNIQDGPSTGLTEDPAYRQNPYSTRHTSPRPKVVSKKREFVSTPRFVLSVSRKVRAKFPTLQKWLLNKFELNRSEQALNPTRNLLDVSIAPSIGVSIVHDDTMRTESHQVEESEVVTRDVCAPSSSKKEALDRLKASENQVIQAMSPERRMIWGREQLTAFQSLDMTGSSQPVRPAMVHTGVQVHHTELAPRHQSSLAFVGAGYGSYEFLGGLHGSSSNLSEHSHSLPEFWDLETVFDGMSVSSIPRNLLLESLQRDRRGSGSPRPISLHSVVQQIRQGNRAESRRSFDSTVNAASARGTSVPRGHNRNRLSRQSAGPAFAPPNLGTRASQVQLAPTEGLEHANNHEDSGPSSPSSTVPSPPTP